MTDAAIRYLCQNGDDNEETHHASNSINGTNGISRNLGHSTASGNGSSVVTTSHHIHQNGHAPVTRPTEGLPVSKYELILLFLLVGIDY